MHALIAFTWFFGGSFVCATIMLRREFLISVGGYEPGRRAVEDLELIARLLCETRIKFANLPEHLLLHRRHEQSKYNTLGSVVYTRDAELRKRVIEYLWGEAPEKAMHRFYLLRRKRKLDWAERRAAKRDIRRLIESMIAANWVEPSDKPALVAEMNRRLEQASPRYWQMFCHWRRHHFH